MEGLVYVKSDINYDVRKIKDYLETLPIFEENIFPGNTVLIKPNWVRQTHERNDAWEQVITHPTMIEAIIEIVCKRLQGKGKIIIADAPEGDTDLQKILSYGSINTWHEIVKRNNTALEILDLRDQQVFKVNGVIIDKKDLPGDPRGSVIVNLEGSKSEFVNHRKSERGYFGATLNINEVNKAHDGYTNLYSVSRSVIEADVFINIPKLKTHKKGGITCSLKNLVGINTNKNYLPHHSEGTPSEGGDQFPENTIKSKLEGNLMYKIKRATNNKKILSMIFVPVKRLGKLIFGKTEYIVRSGNWYGNDTLWRMVLDINKVLFYANPDNSLKADNLLNRKRYISIVDGIIGGEGEGPMAPDPVESGLIIAGTNPVSVDCCCAKLMGYDYNKIPTLKKSFLIKEYRIFSDSYEEIKVVSEDLRYNILLKDIDKKDTLNFRPHFGWKGYIELND